MSLCAIILTDFKGVMKVKECYIVKVLQQFLQRCWSVMTLLYTETYGSLIKKDLISYNFCNEAL